MTSNAIAPRARTRMTETLFGGDGMDAKDGFDAWDPKNIANVVAFLAAPASADITGQILVVFGGNIYAMSAFKAVGPGDPGHGLDARGAGRRTRASSSRASARACPTSASSRSTPRVRRTARRRRTPAPRRLLRYGGDVVTEQALGADGAMEQGDEVGADPATDRRQSGQRSSPTPKPASEPASGEPKHGRPRRRRVCGCLWAEWRRPLTIAVGGDDRSFASSSPGSRSSAPTACNFPHVVARHPGVLTQILAQWDAGYYLTLARTATRATPRAATVQTGNRAFYAFGPLYPLLVRITHDVFGFGYITSGEIVSTLGLVVALAALWKLVDLEVGRRAADGACVLLLAWPSAFFLVATYPESVTLAAATSPSWRRGAATTSRRVCSPPPPRWGSTTWCSSSSRSRSRCGGRRATARRGARAATSNGSHRCG